MLFIKVVIDIMMSKCFVSNFVETFYYWLDYINGYIAARGL